MTTRERRTIQWCAVIMAAMVLANTLPTVLFAADAADYAYMETFPYTWFQAVGAWVTSWFGGTVTLP